MKQIFKPQTEWIPPESFPDLSKYDEIAIDLETKDPELKTMGSGSVTSRGFCMLRDSNAFAISKERSKPNHIGVG